MPSKTTSPTVAPLVFAALVACGEDTPPVSPDAGVADSGGIQDGGPVDAAPEDTGTADTGTTDLGASDTSVPDAAPIDMGMDAGRAPIVLGEAAPITSEAPPFATGTHSLSPTPLWGSNPSRPLPTNAWWQNLVLGTGVVRQAVHPYQVRADPGGLHVSFPRIQAEARQLNTVFERDLDFGAAQGLGERSLVDHGPFSATVRWGDVNRNMTAPLVRGMPFASVRYQQLPPILRTQHGFTSVNGSGVGTSVTGQSFELALGNGQRWLLTSTSTLTFRVERDVLVNVQPFTGWLRAALLTGPTDRALLEAHAGRIPTGARMTIRFEQAGSAELRLEWQTEGQGPLLMMRLPHHAAALQNPNEANYRLRVLRGEMVAVIGETWRMLEPLPDISFRAPRPIAGNRETDVRAALRADSNLSVQSTDIYFAGKEIALLARHMLIADELGETALVETYRSSLQAGLEPWLSGSNGDPLVYDQTWGGLVIRGGLTNPGVSFGQGFYNDHHFHYGYLIYACAVLAHLDPAWDQRWGAHARALIRDIANPSGADPYFPITRNKDWFTGHSWASGLFESDFSRNQESTSEAVNAYYAVYLYGLAVGNDDLRDLGQTMLALELRATWTYWQIMSGDDIYPSPFADTKVVGILWDNRVEYNTFFGANTEFIHGIQYLPFTPIAEALLRPSWMREAYPVVAQTLTNPGLAEGWRGFIYMAHATFAPEEAWTEVQGLRTYDNGNSRTNTLYWVATRPQP